MDTQSFRQRKTERSRARFEAAIEARRLEIELFWRRATFFWAFIAAAFAGLAILIDGGHESLATLVAGFGLFASLAWSLVNRGSKVWYENWEERTREVETHFPGALFSLH